MPSKYIHVCMHTPEPTTSSPLPLQDVLGSLFSTSPSHMGASLSLSCSTAPVAYRVRTRKLPRKPSHPPWPQGPSRPISTLPRPLAPEQLPGKSPAVLSPTPDPGAPNCLRRGGFIPSINSSVHLLCAHTVVAAIYFHCYCEYTAAFILRACLLAFKGLTVAHSASSLLTGEVNCTKATSWEALVLSVFQAPSHTFPSEGLAPEGFPPSGFSGAWIPFMSKQEEARGRWLQHPIDYKPCTPAHCSQPEQLGIMHSHHFREHPHPLS